MRMCMGHEQRRNLQVCGEVTTVRCGQTQRVDHDWSLDSWITCSWLFGPVCERQRDASRTRSLLA